MQRILAYTGAAALLLALAVSPSSALLAQTNSFTTGAAVNSPSLTGFSTSGADMGGMLVTWSFAGGGTGFDVWRDIGGGLWGASAGGFQVSLGAGDDTFGSTWLVTNESQGRVSNLRFEGAQGRTLFDCGFNPTGCSNTGSGILAGTDGSAGGYSLETIAGGTYLGSIFGSYTNAVSVTPNPAVGDLFEQLTIGFGDVLGVGQTYLFRADTDNSRFDAPPPTIVPEPGTYALMLAGLAGLGLVARRRRTA